MGSVMERDQVDRRVQGADRRDRVAVDGGDLRRVVVRGVVSGVGAAQLRQAALGAVDATPADLPVVIDLVACAALDDAALVALICADHHAVRSGRRLVLRGPSRRVRDQIRSLAASLLPLVEQAPEDATQRPFSAVLDTVAPRPATSSRAGCVGACACGAPGLCGARSSARIPRWRDPLRRPSRPPMVGRV